MRSLIIIEDADVQAVQSLTEKMRDHPFVQSRIERNIQTMPPRVSQSDMWHALIMCLLTTQNKSGFGSTVDTFLSHSPFALDLATCRDDPAPDAMIEQVLSQLGIRRWKISAGFAANNLHVLEQGGWELLDSWRQRLFQQRNCPVDFDHYILEREAARAVQSLLKGLGPKQSRNFWQELGLSRNEIPIDSRILKWCNSTLNYHIPVSGLADEQYYGEIMDSIRELCKRSGITPCLLDAAVFASFEKLIL